MLNKDWKIGWYNRGMEEQDREIKKRLLLVDGSAVMHRAYHAMPGLTDRQGRPTGALYGFVRILLKTIKDLQPTHVAVAFDRREPTFRKEMYIAYQAQRPSMDVELGEQFDRVRELLAAMEVPVYDKAGFEADDVIGTISSQVSKFPSFEVIILTGDRDLMQLVNEKVKLCLPVKGVNEAEVVGINEVEERLEVKPEQVVDYKALVGDASDNYPGVPGVGPKTAVELLEKFGSFEGVYEALGKKSEVPTLPRLRRAGRSQKSEVNSTQNTEGEEIKDHNSEFIVRDSVVKKLIEGKAGGELSKQLATIKKDVEVDFKLEDCEVLRPVRQAEDKSAQDKLGFKEPGRLARVLEEFGFQSLVKMMGLEEAVGNGNEQMRLI